MGCTEGLIRILVFVANFCFLLVGLALLVIGILFTIDYTKYTDAIPDNYQVLGYVPTLSIIIGSIIFVIAFLGCCGALRSSRCMLISYGAILFIIFLIQVGLGIFALIRIQNTTELQSQFNTTIQLLFDKYYATPENTKEAVDLIQTTLECCGTNGSSYWTNGNNPIPDSCPKDYLSVGCELKMYDFVLGSIQLIAIVALSVSVVEVVGAVLALCLSNCIRSNEIRGAYY